MSKNTGKAVFGTLLLGGAAAAVYYSMQKGDKKNATPSTTPGVVTIEETTTTVETGVEYPDNEAELPTQTQSTDTASVRKSSGVKTDAPDGGVIKFKNIDLLKYATSVEVAPVLQDGGPQPLNYIYGNGFIIDNVVPRLGLATDLNDMGSDYKALGTILTEGLAKDRRENIALIKKTLGANSSINNIKENTKERLAILCRRVVEGVHEYWRWRVAYLKKNDDRFSIYVFGQSGKPVLDKNGKQVKKSDADMAKVKERIKRLYQLTDLDKQRIAANVLWAVHQLRNPDRYDDVETLDECIDFIAEYNKDKKVPKGTSESNVVCPDRYFRAIVDAFYEGCFNCEVPRAEVVYWPKEDKDDRDSNLKRRENLAWLSGAVFHGYEKRRK